ncbi:RluA family pseudouridine synthase [Geminisphaera colitermitum]|uniref:RluA family pseudouridine synthase n=1 Tax=Geminisphaera colitermitum TaxID=1148786 RepID=UPI0006949A20|nr:RNA pseudouridine synthase [Geminisphaera colitermitum]
MNDGGDKQQSATDTATDAGAAAGAPVSPSFVEHYRGGRACAWPPRPQSTDPARVRMITAEEIEAWVVHEDERLLVVNKPGDVVCHPSKAGPWSSLAGAVREAKGLEKAHLIFRLDRETSGVVVFAKDERMASRLQRAMQERRVRKEYLAVLEGELREAVTVDQPLGDDLASPVFVKTCVRADGKAAVSHFYPVACAGGFSLVRVRLETGRKHQIRAHASWLGTPVVGDKIYGPDARIYLDFIDTGYTPELAAKLHLPRQALHCAEIDLNEAGVPLVLRAPLAGDLAAFVRERMEGGGEG